MNRSPMRIIEMCAYILIIITAAIWMITGGKLYVPKGVQPVPTPTVIVVPSTPGIQSVPPELPFIPPAVLPEDEIILIL